MLARRAWKSVKVLHDDTSSHLPTPGAQTSRSYVFALRESGVARGEQHAAIRKPEPLEQRLGVPGQQSRAPRRPAPASRSAPSRPCRTRGRAAGRACPCRPRPPRGGSTACTRRTRAAAWPRRAISSRYRFVTGTSAVGMRNRSSSRSAYMSSSNFGSCAVPVIVARFTTTGTQTSS